MTNDLPRTREDIYLEAIRLNAILQGLSVLLDAADGPRDHLEARRAGESLSTLLEVALELSDEVATALDSVEKVELAA